MATSTTNLGLIKPSGTDKIRIAQINQNSDTLDAAVGAVGSTSLQTQMNNVQDAIAIVANGDTHSAITAGQFVYVKNNTHSVAEGLHVATANISANGQITTSNVSADASGGLNALNANFTNRIANYNFGSKTVSDFESALVTYAASMGLREYKHISVEISAASGVFNPTTYVGTLEKLSSDTRLVVTLRNAYESAPGDIEMTYKDGTWTVSSLNTKSYGNIGSGIMAYKSGKTVYLSFESFRTSQAYEANETILTLPTELRPAYSASFIDTLNSDHLRITVGSDGVVACTSALVANRNMRGVATYLTN